MPPQKPSVGHLIDIGNPDTIFIGFNMLSHYIHGNLGKVKICTYTRCCRDTCFFKYILYHAYSKFMWRHIICFKVPGNIHEHFVHGINMNILGCNILKIDIVYMSAYLHIS